VVSERPDAGGYLVERDPVTGLAVETPLPTRQL